MPPVQASMEGASRYAMVLTAFAPMASRVSTMMWVTTMGPPSAAITRTSMSRNPPPRPRRTGSQASQVAEISSRRSRILTRAACGSLTFTNWICAIISMPDTEVVKPPPS